MNKVNNDENIVGVIKSWLAERSTYTLAFLPYFLGMAILAFYAVIVYFVTKDTNAIMHSPVTNAVGSLMFAVISISGVIQVIRQEVPTTIFTSIRGKPAIVLGVIQIVVWAGLGLFLLISAITG